MNKVQPRLHFGSKQLAFWDWVFGIIIFLGCSFGLVLTIAAHASGKAFLEAAVLAAIAVQSDDQALAVPQTAIFDLLLDAATKESLPGKNPLKIYILHDLHKLTLQPSQEVTP